IRRQVAIGGRVLDPHGKPTAGVEVVLRRMTDAARWDSGEDEGPEGAAGGREEAGVAKNFSSGGGIFYFFDVPTGHYTLVGTDRRSGGRGRKGLSVAWDEKGTVKRVVEDLQLTVKNVTEQK